MATRPIDARDWIVEVEDSVSGTWLPIRGLNSLTINIAENRETAEITDFDSNGRYEQDTMQNGASLAVEGFYEQDPATGARDPGQAYVDMWADRLSVDSHNRLRYRHETQTAAWAVWDATVEPGEVGGGNNDKSSWSATFTRSGAPTTMAV
ncbi:phage tail tube protein [Kitasatospora sp. NPDC056181]|uniref:phage tail tube protein n=1 Tax=Kitasatospora sp. NPDC056181 TaxID=3345737 RepID=UPI0035D581BB